MRKLVRQMIKDAQRSGDRIGVDGKTQSPSQIGTDIVRLARMATAIHLAESAQALCPGDAGQSAALPMREISR